jgi:hypothetical protein
MMLLDANYYNQWRWFNYVVMVLLKSKITVSITNWAKRIYRKGRQSKNVGAFVNEGGSTCCLFN